MHESNILCRELSLLVFNHRVLAQVEDDNIPLLERLRFLCIVSSNLDEFFEVRMAYLKRKAHSHPNDKLASGYTAQETIQRASEEVRLLIDKQYRLFNDILIPKLKQEKIVFYRRNLWSAEQRAWIENYFNQELLPILTPIGLDASHPFPRLLNKSLNFVVELEGKDAFGRASGMAIVQAPRILPRIVELPPEICDGNHGSVLLSSILHEFVYKLFRGMNIKGCFQFRLTRDSWLMLDEEETITDLRATVQSELQGREFGGSVRLEVADNCPEHISSFLLEQLQLNENELYRVNGPVNLVRLMAVLDMSARADLKFPPFTPEMSQKIAKSSSILDQIAKRKDILLHHPYQSFEPVVRFIYDAAYDPNVVAIKMTIYRIGSQSPLVKALIAAARARKQVTVVVELMARFDEANNVNWAKRLEEAGAHVVYGVLGYKVHAKMALVIRREEGKLRYYAHLGTGNYHPNNSLIYTDFGLLTAQPELCQDINTLFMEITGLGQANRLQKISQSPFTWHQMVLDYIRAETENARNGKKAKIMAKMNGLLEPEVINALYEASQAGVEIDLIVRGMCALKPQVPNLSENIHVRSIIGRFLEHSRICYFYHDGEEKVYLSSADWMNRNFFRRIETAFPIENKKMKARIIEEGLNLALQDNQNAWIMQSDGSYIRSTAPDPQQALSVQQVLLEKYQKKSSRE